MPAHGASNPPDSFRLQGWDPILILSQMISLQTLHYLTLSLLVPVLLVLLARGPDLDREGGPANVAMLMDWREMAGSSTVPPVVDLEWVSPLFQENARKRSWALALAWLITAQVDVFYLYQLIRKPTHILDFSLTMLFIHLLLTTYYTSAFPKSVFFWIVIGLAAIFQIIWAEQLCIRREMRQGAVGLPWKEREDDAHPQSQRPRMPKHKRATSLPSEGFAQLLGKGLKGALGPKANAAPESYELYASTSGSRGRGEGEEEERQPLVPPEQQQQSST